MLSRRARLCAIAPLLFALAACAPSSSTSRSASPRPDAWAKPLSRPGLPNLNQITPDLYRSAQPTAEGMKELKSMGVKTVLNLRAGHSDEDLAGQTGLAIERLKLKTWSVDDEAVAQALRVMTDKSRAPLLVHCQHGADRTGVMCAAYRVVVQNWDKEEAIREMTEGGYGFHSVWQNLIQRIRDMDVEAIRRKLNAPPSPQP